MTELFIATANRGKLLEFKRLVHTCVGRVFSLEDYPDLPAVLEDGATFEENAVKKALSAARFTGKPAIADDSGLLVESLNGRPGVHSARFAGDAATDADNNDKLLREMAGVPHSRRTAMFHSVIALCTPEGTCEVFDGELRGVILEEPRGEGGFGYDPLFLVPDYGLTLAELSLHDKNAISHRGRAFLRLKEFLQRR